MEDKENVYTPIEYFGHCGIERRRRGEEGEGKGRPRGTSGYVSRAGQSAISSCEYRYASCSCEIASKYESSLCLSLSSSLPVSLLPPSLLRALSFEEVVEASIA